MHSQRLFIGSRIELFEENSKHRMFLWTCMHVLLSLLTQQRYQITCVVVIHKSKICLFESRSWREYLLKYGLFTVLAFVSVFSIVGVVFGNPIPWDPWNSLLNLDPLQYFYIIIAEFCSLIVGTSILVHNHQTQLYKAASTMLIALIVSFALGIAIWTLGYLVLGIHNQTNPDLLGSIILLLPEFIGIVVGSVIIQKLLRASWKTAFITMTTAMLTSFLFSILMANVYLSLI